MEGFGEEAGSPLLGLERWSPGRGVWAKAEHLLPSGSVFDRIAGPLLARGEGPCLVAGCGSACLSFAAAAARRGRPLTVVIPAETLKEHRMMLAEHQIHPVAVEGGLWGADAAARTLAAERGLPLVYAPGAGAEASEVFESSVVAELSAQLDDLGGADAVVLPSGVVGLAEALQRRLSARVIETFGEPSGLQDGTFFDESPARVEAVTVLDPEAYECRRAIARTEGLLLGWASASALLVARRTVELGQAERAVAIVLDGGDRYFSRDAQMAHHEPASPAPM